MLREGQTALVTLDAGKRTSNVVGPLPFPEMASSLSAVRNISSQIDGNNNNLSESMKSRLPPLIMPNQSSHGTMDKDHNLHPTPVTITSQTPFSSDIFIPSPDSGRKRSSNSNFTPMISAKKSCLPFGYCYETNENDLWLLDDDADMKMDNSSLPQMEDDLWMYSDDRTPDLLLSNNPWISSNRKNYRSKVDVGPTLAQLNSSSDLWDTLDLDELLSCSGTAAGGVSAMNQQTPKNNNFNNFISVNHLSAPQQQSFGNNVPFGKSGQTRNGLKKEKENIEVRSAIELQDPKLQANVEYLQNLLVSNSVNQSPSSEPNHGTSSGTSTTISPSHKSYGKKKDPINKTSSVQPSISPQVKIEQPPPSDIIGCPQSTSANCSQKRNVEKKKLSAKKDVSVDMVNASSKILGSIHNVKKEPLDDFTTIVESINVKIPDEKKGLVSQRRSSTEKPKKRSVRRTRNSNSQCTEKSSASSNDEGFVEEAETIEPEDVEMEDDIEEEDEDDDNESEVMDSDDESFYGDYEAKDLLGATTSDDQENRWALNMGRSRKGGPQRYFWQYNVQAKGPKGSKSSLGGESNDTLDPHVLGEVSDPVFAPDCQVKGVKHAGKARRGDGNDLTPNPRKLLMIGLELKKLSKTINDLTPVADVPVAARNKTRKEKNKLASRACRLKKKAQHEANKIKLYGLQNEHQKMLKLLSEIKSQVTKVLNASENGRKVSALTASMANLFNEGVGKVIVAGNTSDFVNSVLDNVAAGQTDGGLK